jgi:hypothetical protein
MATTTDFFIWQCPQEQIDFARRNAELRIANGEYARDRRLDDEQRTPDNGDFRTRVGLIIDVKTQENQYTPQADWRCEVTDEQIGRPADIYVFCKLRIVGQSYTLYIVGWEYENDFKTNAIYRKRGDLLRGKPVHYPKWDITILELKTMNSLIPVII